MGNLDRVTITGADDHTRPEDMLALSAQYPFLEWGILMSPRREGGVRFPSKEWMQRLASLAHPKTLRVSLHLCGGYVRDFLQGENPSWYDHTDMWNLAQRVQFNFHGEPHTAALRFRRLMFGFPLIQFIFQLDGTPNHAHFLQALDWGFDAVPLFDTSGGAGQLPKEWPRANLTIGSGPIYHGYAGGLGPGNIHLQLPMIKEAADEATFWIDMEGQVRTDGLLDLYKAAKVLSFCDSYMKERNA